MNTYDNYKKSNIPWIGEIPEHWSISSLKWLSNIYSGGTPDKNKSEYWENGTIPWLNSGSVNQQIIKTPSSYITPLGLDNSSAKWIPKDSIVIALAGQGKTKGMVAQVQIKTTCNQSLGVIVPNDINSKYLYYFLKNNYLIIRGFAGEGKRDGLNLQIVGNINTLLPPLPEQKTIATYLDHKTAEIDDLIQTKKALIQKYQEHKNAIINQAVTKGINDVVEMKDSGIEWLGDIPKHWEVKKLKYVAESLNYRRIPLNSEERGKMLNKIYDYYGASGVIDKVEDYIFDKPHILIGEDGANLITRSSRLVFIAKGKYWVNNHAHIIQPKEGSLEYFCELLELYDFSIWVSGSAQPKLTSENLMSIDVIVPPLEEQQVIVNHIKTKTQLIDQKVAIATEAVTLLEEYRTALISDVVTGKIKIA